MTVPKYFPGTYIPMGVASTEKMNHLIDDLLSPRLLGFRQIHINEEPAELLPDKVTWKVTFGNWLQNENCVRIWRNNKMVRYKQIKKIDWEMGQFVMGSDPDLDAAKVPRDTMIVDYIFDYFPAKVQEGFLTAAVSVINMRAVGPPTSYTLETAPTNWEGVIVDLAFAMCMERLLLDYDLWRYRLVFAVGPGDVEGGGAGDIASQLTTLKQNAEERANAAMDNPKFKTGNYLSPPTVAYYQAIRGFGTGYIGGVWQGRLHGWKPNRYL